MSLVPEVAGAAPGGTARQSATAEQRLMSGAAVPPLLCEAVS